MHTYIYIYIYMCIHIYIYVSQREYRRDVTSVTGLTSKRSNDQVMAVVRITLFERQPSFFCFCISRT